MSNYHLYLHTPTPIFKARVNLPGSITYPVVELDYDSVSLGAYTDLQPSMTLLLGTTEGADDLGRVRIKPGADATTIFLPRTARGIEDGTLDVRDGAYITVLEDWRVWAKIPYFDLGEETNPGNDYKDGDIVAGTNNTQIPPVANTGPAVAGYIDSVSSLLTVTFPDFGVDQSYAMADGASLSTYAWDVGDGTITVGTSASAVITATFPAGFRWISLTVTDSNNKSHTAWCPVLAIDPANDPTLKEFSATQRLEVRGQTLDIQLLKPLARSDYPDGTLVLLWWGAAASAGDRSHMKFVGWLDRESYSVGRKREGIGRTTSLHAVDVAGRLNLLPGFPQALERTESDSLWSWMDSLDMSKSLYYLLQWHSTALDVADFFLPTGGVDYNAMRLDASGASLFSQVDSQAQKMVPDHYLACNSQGQLRVQRDWMLDDVGDRPTAGPILTEDLWNELSFDYNRHPKVHSLRSGAILSSESFVVVDGEDTLPLVFSIAPGEAAAFSQGTVEASENEGLALSQDDLNVCEGHRYALRNSRYGPFTFKDPTNSGFWDYEPALFARIQLNIGASYAAYRDLQETQLVGRVQEIMVNYKTGKTGTSLSTSVTFQKEEEGAPALTYNPDTGEVTKVPYTPPAVTWTPPDYDDPNVYFGDMKGYLLWDAVNVFRTWDLQADPPTWELVTGDITGDIIDIQYVMTAADAVGAWALTVDGVWWCADIMATTPSWSNTLDKATMQAAETQPPSGATQFKGMAAWGITPGYLVVTTGPDVTSFASDYLHAYFWHTHDYGQNWTTIDHTSDFFSHLGVDTAYSYTGPFGVAMYRDLAGVIYCARMTQRVGTSGRSAVFVSTDQGHTWTKKYEIASPSDRIPGGSILHPYPNQNDPGYWVRGNASGVVYPKLYRTVDEWSGASELATFGSYPTGHSSLSNVWRINKHTFDNNHIIAWFRQDASPHHYRLFESDDGGSTWTQLYDSASPGLSYDRAVYDTPNGWPPDVDQWVLVSNIYDTSLDANSKIIYLTLDNFQNLLDKKGNIGSLVSAWVVGNTQTQFAGGFALPRVGVNA